MPAARMKEKENGWAAGLLGGWEARRYESWEAKCSRLTAHRKKVKGLRPRERRGVLLFLVL